MAEISTVSQMDGMFKEQYGTSIDDVLPGSAVLQDIIAFDTDNKLGDSYHQTVVLTHENGFTYGGTGGTSSSLITAVAATQKDATVTSAEMIGRARMQYTTAARAAAGGKQAFAKAWGTILMNLRKAAVKRAELSLLYGQQGLGVVSSNSSGTLTITDASWSPTTWAGLEGAVLEAFTAITVGSASTQHNADLTISAVSFANKTVTVTGTNSSVVQNDVLFFKGAGTAATNFASNEMAGLMKIAANSGSLFGIDAASYALWAGNSKSSLGVPTMGKILDAVTDAVDRGLEEKVFLLVCPKTWEVLNADLAAQRKFDGSYRRERAENGAQAISYYGQVGEIEVRVHPYLRRGDSVMFPKSCLKRVGSTDVGMGVPGTDGRDVFFHLQDVGAVEARTYTDQALFCEAPAHCSVLSGITYS